MFTKLRRVAAVGLVVATSVTASALTATGTVAGRRW